VRKGRNNRKARCFCCCFGLIDLIKLDGRISWEFEREWKKKEREFEENDFNKRFNVNKEKQLTSHMTSK
jgi:hypothetical protein